MQPDMFRKGVKGLIGSSNMWKRMASSSFSDGPVFTTEWHVQPTVTCEGKSYVNALCPHSQW